MLLLTRPARAPCGCVTPGAARWLGLSFPADGEVSLRVPTGFSTGGSCWLIPPPRWGFPVVRPLVSQPWGFGSAGGPREPGSGHGHDWFGWVCGWRSCPGGFSPGPAGSVPRCLCLGLSSPFPHWACTSPPIFHYRSAVSAFLCGSFFCFRLCARLPRRWLFRSASAALLWLFASGSLLGCCGVGSSALLRLPCLGLAPVLRPLGAAPFLLGCPSGSLPVAFRSRPSCGRVPACGRLANWRSPAGRGPRGAGLRFVPFCGLAFCLAVRASCLLLGRPAQLLWCRPCVRPPRRRSRRGVRGG